jgi:hypothetical protein
MQAKTSRAKRARSIEDAFKSERTSQRIKMTKLTAITALFLVSDVGLIVHAADASVQTELFVAGHPATETRVSTDTDIAAGDRQLGTINTNHATIFKPPAANSSRIVTANRQSIANTSLVRQVKASCTIITHSCAYVRGICYITRIATNCRGVQLWPYPHQCKSPYNVQSVGPCPGCQYCVKV